MSDTSIRLGLVGQPGETDSWANLAPRIQACKVSTVADSVEAALADDPDVDALVVHSPCDAILAADAGKHVLASAPVGESLEEAGSVVDACSRAGVNLSLCQTLRYLPANQIVSERLTSGKLGEPGLLRVHRWNAGPGNPLARVLFGDIDLAIHFFGAGPSSIYAIRRGEEAYVQVHLGFPAGGMAVLDFSSGLPEGRGYDSLSLIGSRGAAYADDHHNTHLLFAGGNPTALVSDAGSGHRMELQVFVDAIRSGAPGTGDGCQAVHQVIESVDQSIKSGQVLHEKKGHYEPA